MKGLERIVVAGGGTGGHLFPGLAVLEALRARRPGLRAWWVGTARGIEARRIPPQGIPLTLLPVRPLKGGGVRGLLRGLGSVPASLLVSTRLLREVAPDLVLGVGGYASGPVLLAAAAMGLPTALLEQNASVGLTNRLLGPVVGRAYVSFEETVAAFPPGRARWLGNPVRRAFAEAAAEAARDPAGLEARADTLLVLGGSQGARALDEAVPGALGRLGLAERGLRVLHQAGGDRLEQVRRRYDAAGVRAKVVPFIEDVAGAMRRAAVVVARAGATTVAELTAIGRPAVLVPYPHAADDHQRANAEALQRAGAARCLLERELSPERLAAWLRELLDDEAARRRMAAASRALGRPGAAADIAEDLLGWLERGGRRAARGGGAGGVRGSGPPARGRGDEDEDDGRCAMARSGVHRTARRPSQRVGGEGLQWVARGAGRPSGVRGQRPYVPVRRAGRGARAAPRPRLLAEPGLLELD